MHTYRVNDIIGPIMVGPSSSHTAGALRIALMTRHLFGNLPQHVEFVIYGSFAHTYHGHGTDRALVAGMLGLQPDDLRIRDSFKLAHEAGLEVAFTCKPDVKTDHPNTVDIIATDGEITVRVRGVSIGGGAAQLTKIDDVDVVITGERTSIIVAQRDERGVLAHIANCLNASNINIANARLYRRQRGSAAFTIMETDSAIPEGVRDAIMLHQGVWEVRIIPAEHPIPPNSEEPTEELIVRSHELDYPDAKAVLAYCREHYCTIADAFRDREEALAAVAQDSTPLDSYLARVWAVMKESALGPLEHPLASMGGLIGGEGQQLTQLCASGKGLVSDSMSRLSAFAMAVLETNASMGRIVAAPTAGSSGVLPAVLLTLDEQHGYTDKEIYDALLTAACVGCLISRNATVSGAEGGCQAEIGSAAAMAAAAAVSLAKGSPDKCFDAASNAIASMLGLVCDPVGGLVEVPCQKRNASGAVNALIAAESALAGISKLIGFDEMVAALEKVGRSLPFELRESALGGMAATPSACAWCESCSR